MGAVERPQYSAAELARRQASLDREKEELRLAAAKRAERDTRRLESAVISTAVANETVRQCFVEGSRHDPVVYKLFKEEEKKRAAKRGRPGVGINGITVLMEKCTGCRPSRPEAEAMMAGSEGLDYDDFALTLEAVRQGTLRFASLQRTLADFDDLCRAIPDAKPS